MKKTKAKNIILVLLAVLCVAVLLYTLYQGLIIYIPQKQEQQRFDELKQIVEREREESSAPVQTKPTGDDTQPVYTEEENPAVYSDIVRINDDFRGWLKIKDMVIDYPVVKSSDDDPEFYLHRDYDKNYSFSGTPFIGAGADENSDAFVIYAHNMNNGTRIFEQNPSTSTNRTFTIVPSPESNCIGRWFLISDEPKLLFAGHSVTIGKATSIGKWAFEDCDSLRSVTILRRFVNSQKAVTAVVCRFRRMISL